MLGVEIKLTMTEATRRATVPSMYPRLICDIPIIV